MITPETIRTLAQDSVNLFPVFNATMGLMLATTVFRVAPGYHIKALDLIHTGRGYREHSTSGTEVEVEEVTVHTGGTTDITLTAGEEAAGRIRIADFTARPKTDTYAKTQLSWVSMQTGTPVPRPHFFTLMDNDTKGERDFTLVDRRRNQVMGTISRI